MKYYDVFGDTGYHSAFLTTFSFTAQAFEDVPFPKLRGAGCRNVTVLADQSMLNLSLEEFGVPRFAGSLYHLAKVNVPGAFHPKITLLLGKEKGRLLVGSANLTALGIAGNRELVADVSYTPDDPRFLPLFRQAFEYIESYIPAGDPWFPVARERALSLSPWLAGERPAAEEDAPDGLALLLDRGPATILEQVAAAVGDDKITRLVVMSPYWDRKLEGLRQLREALGTPTTDLLIERSRGEFPTGAYDDSSGIELFDIEGEGGGRFNHAKLVVALGRDWDHVVSGSVNCTLPALLGSTIASGNAEAAVYKRVAPGTALARLGLEGYRGAQLDPSSLPEPVHSTARAEDRGPREAGTFQLRANRITWKPAPGLKEVPTSACLLDRLGASPWAQLAISDLEETGWSIDLESERPRAARVQFADGSFSAVSMVLDVDVLAPSTLPSSGGRKAKVADRLLGAIQEDLELVGFLAELETIELDEIGAPATKFAKTTGDDKGEEERTFSTLSYEDYVKARERREASKGASSSFLVGRANRAADLVSSCLNRLIGLVSRDLAEEEDAELKRVASQDPTTKEPSANTTQGAGEEEGPTPPRTAPEPEEKALRRARSDKIVDAIAAFETRAKALRGKKITTTELVRLRLLLQVVLNYAEPVDAAETGGGTLPLADKAGHGWARLLGRLLMQHFGAFVALKDLRLEEDENEQLRVIEYLATAYFASEAARQAVAGHPRADVLGKPMERLASGIAQQVATVVRSNKADEDLFWAVIQKLDARFNERLGISGVSRLPGAPGP